jgi:hypothetical protein
MTNLLIMQPIIQIVMLTLDDDNANDIHVPMHCEHE